MSPLLRTMQTTVEVSDMVSHLAPCLSLSLYPALNLEVGIKMLYLADIPGGKTVGVSQLIIATLTLWDRKTPQKRLLCLRSLDQAHTIFYEKKIIAQFPLILSGLRPNIYLLFFDGIVALLSGSSKGEE